MIFLCGKNQRRQNKNSAKVRNAYSSKNVSSVNRAFGIKKYDLRIKKKRKRDKV